MLVKKSHVRSMFLRSIVNRQGRAVDLKYVPPAGGPTDHIQTFHVSFVATCRIFAHLAVWVVKRA